MYSIEKVKRKILINNKFKMKTLYKCFVKFGTHGTTIMYLFDYPLKETKNKGFKDEDNYTIYSLFIEEVREDNFIILYLQ